MYILEVSYGYPSEKYPLNGVFQMDQAKALADIGHKVVLVAIDVRSVRKWRRWGIFQHTVNDLPVMEFNFPMGPILPGVRSKISKIGFSIVLQKVVSQYGKPDVVHVHFGDTAQCVVEACKRANIPYVITEHSSGINRDDLKEAEVAPMRYVYKNAAAVIAVSKALAKRIEYYSGISPVVIPNIIDFQKFTSEKKSHDIFQFISAGNLNKGKGFDIVIMALAKLISRGINAKLIIMGDGPEKKNLVELVQKYGLQGNVVFWGVYVRPQFAEKLVESDCFVLASRGETFGVVYAEALACGVPVVATRCGGPEDFVDESNGILVDVDDVEGLTEAMTQMYKNYKTYNMKIISQNAKKQFLNVSVAKNISVVLEECLNEIKNC